jgi:type IV fimbrial biogenesis protein FimT
MKHKRISGGFTLPELIITLGVVSILLSVAVPSLNTTIKNNRLATQLNSVMADIHFARSEAAKRGLRIILCRSPNPNLPSPVCGGTEQIWTTGYIVFADDGNYTNNWYDPGVDTLLRRGQPAQTGVRMYTTSTWNNNLEINSNGMLNEGGSATMAICDDRDTEFGRQITVTLNGVPRMYSGNIDDCTPHNPD